ncbi:MAG TPA: PQQ-dependent sugar dehydrogenase, partial [Actinomycetota bacterium]|nr:PQQ-dependent sugar dehydrogenase [Actinomycetota bacterium]
MTLVVPARASSTTIQRVPPGGAPPRGSGDLSYPGFVRVIDGDTVELYLRGTQVGVGFIGIDAPRINARCGQEAAATLADLLQQGVELQEDLDVTFDERLRRMYYGFTPDGRSIALEMVRRGMARASGQGREAAQLHRAQADARSARRGCLWRGRAGADGLLGSGSRLATTASAPLANPSLPPGFSVELVAGGFSVPTSFAFLPDGRMLVAEQSGIVRIVKDGQVLATPFLDIRDRVNYYWDRGLLGIAVDPDFATNGYVYLAYTYENNPAQPDGPKTARVSRFTATGDTASPSTETVILGTAMASSCNDLPRGADCIPSDAPSHTIGTIKFAGDGTIFVTTGDGAHFNTVNDNALRAQDLDSLAGKVLHVTRDGKGIPSNPFWNGDPNANRSKVWALGVRNAYRFNLRPGTSIPYLGDVGWNTWEEIDVATPGANFGWPCYEGEAIQSGYEPKPVCQALYAQGPSAHTLPLVTYNHDGRSAAVTGGTFYTGTEYPEEFRGAYFYGDYAMSFLRYLKVDADNRLVSGPTDFATDAQAPVDMAVGPNGDLYYLSIATGEVLRIRFGTPPPPPTGPYRDEVLSDAPLGYWRLGEASGTTASDASGGGHDGTYLGGATLGAPGLL